MMLGLFSWLFGNKEAPPAMPAKAAPEAKPAEKAPAKVITQTAPSKPETEHVILPGGKEDRLGDILLKHNIITPEKLQKALAIQASQEHPKFLGEILIDQNMLTEDELVSVVSRQFKIPYIKINKYGIDREILKLIPEELVREHLVLPLGKMGRELTVGMADPQDRRTIQTLESLTGCEIKIVLCKLAEIKDAIRGVYETAFRALATEPAGPDPDSAEPTTTVLSAPGVPLSQLTIKADTGDITEGTTDVVHVSEMPVRKSPFIIKGAKPPEPDDGGGKKNP